MGLEQNVVRHLIENMYKAVPKWRLLIQKSFLTSEMKEKYEQLVMNRMDRLHLGLPLATERTQEHTNK